MAFEIPDEVRELLEGKEITPARRNAALNAIASKLQALSAVDFARYLNFRSDLVLQGAGGAPRDLGSSTGSIMLGARNVASYMYGANAANFPAALQAAIDKAWLDYAPAYTGSGEIKGNVCWIPAGTYTWKDGATSVSVAPNLTIEGAGAGRTIIKSQATALIWLVVGNRAWNWSTFAATGGARGRLVIRGITFDCTSTLVPSGGSNPIRFLLPTASGQMGRGEVILEDCHFVGCNIGALFNGGNVVIRNCLFQNCHYGVYLNSGSSDAPRAIVQRSVFISSGSSDTQRPTSFIYLEDPTGFVGTQIIDCTFDGKVATSGMGLQILNAGTIVDGCAFSGFGGSGAYAIRVSNTPSGVGGAWSVVTNNQIAAEDPTANYAMPAAIRVDHSGLNIIAGNSISGGLSSNVSFTYGIDVDDPSGSCLGSNRIEGNGFGRGVTTAIRAKEQVSNPYNFRSDTHKPDVHRYGHTRSNVAMCDLALLTAGAESVPTAQTPWRNRRVGNFSFWVFDQGTANKAVLAARMWKAVAHGFNAPVRAVETFKGRLVAGGDFSQSGWFALGTWISTYFKGPVQRIAAFAGAYWEQYGPGLNGSVSRMLKSGNKLYIAGSFTTNAARTSGIDFERITVTEDGKSFSQIGGPTSPGAAEINALIEHGQHILAGGVMTTVKRSDAGSSISVEGICPYNPSTGLWEQPLAGGAIYGVRSRQEGGATGIVYCMARLGDAILIGGNFHEVDGWDGVTGFVGANARHLAILRGAANDATEFQPLTFQRGGLGALGVDAPVTVMASFGGWVLVGGQFSKGLAFGKTGTYSAPFEFPAPHVCLLQSDFDPIADPNAWPFVALSPGLPSEPGFMVPISGEETGSVFGARVLVGGVGYLKLLIFPDQPPVWDQGASRTLPVTWVDLPLPANFLADPAEGTNEPAVFLGAKVVADKVVVVGEFAEGRGSADTQSYGVTMNQEV